MGSCLRAHGDLAHEVAAFVGSQACSSLIAGGVIACLDAGNTGRSGGFHGQVCHLADHSSWRMATLGLSTSVAHLCVPLVLLLRVGESIPDGNASQRNLDAIASLVHLPNLVADGRDIVACIALAKDVEL